MNLSKIIFFVTLGGFALMLFIPWRLPENGRPFEKLFRDSERKHGMPKNLLARVAYQESRFRDDIISGRTISKANAQGIMQLVPRWHPSVDPLDPSVAIPYAGEYLKRLYKRFGSWSDALAAYNWGEGNLNKWLKGGSTPMPQETKDYVSQIMGDVFKV
jgi:soluble lytic murein transglycosylase-like protein